MNYKCWLVESRADATSEVWKLEELWDYFSNARAHRNKLIISLGKENVRIIKKTVIYGNGISSDDYICYEEVNNAGHIIKVVDAPRGHQSRWPV